MAVAADSVPSVQVLGKKGYVWDAEGAKRLRLQHRIIGAMVGGVAQFKNQNAVGGLPLQLTAHEVTLCLEKGWITLAPSPQVRPVDHSMRKQSKQQKVQRQQPQELAAAACDGRGSRSHQGWALRDEDGESYDDYYGRTADSAQTQPTHAAMPAEEHHAAPSTAARQQQQQQQQAKQQQQQQQQQAKQHLKQQEQPWATQWQQGQQQGDADAGNEKLATSWKDALAKGLPFQLPLLPTSSTADSVTWQHPVTPQEQLSYAIFRDLHNKGFAITGGIKFGAEFLVYPGDPSLYHAQFTVRTMPWDQAIDPVLLKSIARGSHAARKHLLLASARPTADSSGNFMPFYISVAPQLGFGHQNQ